MPYSQMMMQPGTGAGMPPFGHPYAAAAFMGGGGPPFSYPPGFGAAGFVPPHTGNKKGESGSGESSSSPKGGVGSGGDGSGNFGYPSPMFAFPPFAFHPFAHFPKSNKTPGLRLAMQCDAEQLSEYQMAIRQHLELFEAGPEDVESNTQGRKRAVRLGQVGLRCRHCSGAPLRTRGRGAVYYPAKLSGIYQVGSLFRLSPSPVVALSRCLLLETRCWLTLLRPSIFSYTQAAQNMAQSHITGACQHIAQSVKVDLLNLRNRRDNASGGKQYWADGCRALGVYETESEGLRMKGRPTTQQQQQAAAGDLPQEEQQQGQEEEDKDVGAPKPSGDTVNV